ncbi:MAG TPA: cupin domain-containing protein, partial [Thermoanaerobaculia bacterium]|nr:cupin domain-containing protein [Thermoanaerobaculia bacterium]
MSDALSHDDLEILNRITAESIDPIAPPPSVRARVLAAIKPLDHSVPGSHESITVRAEEGRWTEVAPGARLKRLNKDAARGTITSLLELAPHALVPAHDHEGGEDSYVIRGSCRIGALALNAGDYHHADAASH